MKTRPWRNFLNKKYSALALSFIVFGLFVDPAFAVPTDPQRSFDVVECNDALMRLREALVGNPLISEVEMHDVIVEAFDWANQLCEPERVQELTNEFGHEGPSLNRRLPN